MAKDTHKSHKLSELEKTPISFEYDMSWRDARQLVKDRTHKK